MIDRPQGRGTEGKRAHEMKEKKEKSLKLDVILLSFIREALYTGRVNGTQQRKSSPAIMKRLKQC